MNRRVFAMLILAGAAAAMLATDGNARQARRRDLQQRQETELDTTSLTPEMLRKSFIGTWNDQGGRFWFQIENIAGTEVRSVRFRQAHFTGGHIEGDRLIIGSQSCVPVIGCYGYTIQGKLLANSRMDIRGTDDTGETVHFVLVRK